MKSPKPEPRHRGAGQEHPEVTSKRSEALPAMGRAALPWAGSSIPGDEMGRR